VNEQAYRAAEATLWEWAERTPTERRVRLAHLGTEVRVQEVGEGEPVLFIHGGPNSGSTWAPLVRHLDGFRCLLLDRPGTGLSEPFPWRTDAIVPFASALVGDVLDGLGIERAHVVASSFGGYCALMSAAATPDRFERMVQMACPAALPGQQFPAMMKALLVPGLRLLIRALPPSHRVNRSIMRQIGHGASLDAGRIQQEFLDWYLALGRHTDTLRNDGTGITALARFRGMRPETVCGAETLAAAVVPTHFIWGADDAFGAEDVARWVVEKMPNATLEMIEGSGHLPWLDFPDQVADATRSFLEGESRS
jgi:2-hydroxy-6-oxonona-2,4-dienedioate hydrolase